ncbi:hypothetical protein COCON_G00004790 [Conger conger]|uniref:C-type lectin domain-containing protein n=1 Tax=Conger conger TaxID=82655 RepID=A0A9Q1I8G0_CONCO|nr:killer cell lectin-like receptor subfamily B member 1B allele B isoform X2 [Conger conger]KAJ8287820.1 hypothetical protein COCON_G00004790 [Conger conger]
MKIKIGRDYEIAEPKTKFPDESTKLQDVQRRARLYLGLCIILALLSLILLLGICILGTARQSRCNDVEEKRCTPQECRPFCPDQALPCTNCDAGWHGFEGSCFYLSNDLHTWRESRDQCKKMAGDLAVIKNQRLQDFLVKKGTMMYWIGVTHVKSGMPFWVNDTVAESNLAGSQIEKCGFLIGRSDPNDKWKTTICSHSSAYICQK